MRLPRFTNMQELQAWANRSKKPTHLTPSEYLAREEGEQKALVQWRDLMVHQMPELRWLFHVPNGELRHPAVAVKLLKMGVLPGVADFLWLTPKNEWHGLIFELKAEGGTLTPKQAEFLSWTANQGFLSLCLFGQDEAKRIILDYYRGKI